MKMGHKLEEPVEATKKPKEDPVYYPTVHLDSKESRVLPAGCQAGQMFSADVKVKVSSVSVDDNGNGEKRRATLEIHEMNVEEPDDADEGEKKALGYDRKSDPNYKRMKRKEQMGTPKARDLR